MKQFIFFGILAATLLGVGLYSLVVKITGLFRRKKPAGLSSGYYID